MKDNVPGVLRRCAARLKLGVRCDLTSPDCYVLIASVRDNDGQRIKVPIPVSLAIRDGEAESLICLKIQEALDAGLESAIRAYIADRDGTVCSQARRRPIGEIMSARQIQKSMEGAR